MCRLLRVSFCRGWVVDVTVLDSECLQAALMITGGVLWNS